jgi:hypothetical protein
MDDGRRGGKAVPEQLKLSDYMNKMWAEFAKDPENGLTKLGLPTWDPKGRHFSFSPSHLKLISSQATP